MTCPKTHNSEAAPVNNEYQGWCSFLSFPSHTRGVLTWSRALHSVHETTNLLFSFASHQGKPHTVEKAAAQRLGRRISTEHRALYTGYECSGVPSIGWLPFSSATHGDEGKEKSHKNVQTTGTMLATVRGVDRGSCKNRLV